MLSQVFNNVIWFHFKKQNTNCVVKAKSGLRWQIVNFLDTPRLMILIRRSSWSSERTSEVMKAMIVGHVAWCQKAFKLTFLIWFSCQVQVYTWGMPVLDTQSGGSWKGFWSLLQIGLHFLPSVLASGFFICLYCIVLLFFWRRHHLQVPSGFFLGDRVVEKPYHAGSWSFVNSIKISWRNVVLLME